MCMNNPKISIIVPVYNVENYLAQCVESVLSLTFEDFELLLIDDGSIDKSGEMCDSFAKVDNRIKVFHTNNNGVSSARNVGLNYANGEWIWFVDSDDVVNSHLDIASVFSQIGENDYVLFKGITFDDGKQIPISKCRDSINIIHYENKNDFLLQNVCHNHFLIFYKREVISTYGLCFPEDMKVAEDEEFHLKYLIVCNSPVKVDNNLYYYRIREGSAMNNTHTYEEIVSCSEKLIKHLLSFPKAYRNSDEWLHYRLESVLKQYLSAICHFDCPNYEVLQAQYRQMVKLVKETNPIIPLNRKLTIAYYNIRFYVWLFKSYHKLKSF